ncbi:hypothetical protein RUM43_010029 [Polyplax serrata]|uniref:RanBD1 domain-containing protein n=1 Tax=Polyplax serrata TaxID=468196 RepID=A0AAN8S4L7_POLSC
MSEVDKEQAVVDEKNCDNETAEDAEHDPHYDPIISLPEVVVPTLEEDETVMLCLRAKLYRYDANVSPPEWKERGTGYVKILSHKFNSTVRVVMRRDKTLKLCANHFISPSMVLKPSVSCDRAWVYSVKDFSDGTVKSELLAIKFANIENAHKWKDTFDEGKKIVANSENLKGSTTAEDKLLIGDSPVLNDTFEEEKKNLSVDKNDEKKAVPTKKVSSEITPEKLTNPELNEKLSSMSIKSTS